MKYVYKPTQNSEEADKIKLLTEMPRKPRNYAGLEHITEK